MRVEVYWIDGVRPGRLAVLPRPRGGDWLDDEARSLRAAGVDVLVSMLTRDEAEELGLTAEANCCAAAGLEFVSFPIADRGVPTSAADFGGLVRRLAAAIARGEAIAVHCRQGIGRAALVAACVLAARGDRPNAAFERVARARGRPVPDTPEQRAWGLRFAEQFGPAAAGPTLLLSTRGLPDALALSRAALRAGWAVRHWDDGPPNAPGGRLVYYGYADVVQAAAARCQLALLEPPLDLLTRLPAALLRRRVEFGRFRDLVQLARPAFVKPADPLDRCFDAGVYASGRDIRAPRGLDPDLPVLVAEPVEWLAEFRCFVRDGRSAAWSPYLSFGRPVWRAWGRGGERATPPSAAVACVGRLLAECRALPPAFVVDVGLVADRGWAVVEFNPAWCSGLLGSDPAAVLGVLDRACRPADTLSAADAAWIVNRSGPREHHDR